jgi:hypothetical protein
MKTHRKFLFALVASVALTSVNVEAQRGARTVSRGLDQLTEEADVIVHGSVVSAKVEPHPQFKNLMTVVINLRVQETLKGRQRSSMQFRQYIWDIRDQIDAARYAKGQELLLMLGPVSEHGLTSPVGLEQGRFRISRDINGQAIALNGNGNVGLFQSVARRAEKRGVQLPPRVKALSQSPQSGPVPLADLESAIRSLGAQQ